MVIIYAGSQKACAAQRPLLFEGQILVSAPRPPVIALTQRVAALVDEAFAPRAIAGDPPRMTPATFLAVVSVLKRRVAEDQEALRLLAALLAEAGCDPARTFVHRLFLRAVPSAAEPGPAVPPYHAPLHRDVWLANPAAQVNWWIPVRGVDGRCCVAFYPAYWSRPVGNSSGGFDYDSYRRALGALRHAVATGQRAPRGPAVPAATEAVDDGAALHPACPDGGLMLFSAAQLHASVPNRSGVTRFSLDVRTVHLDDLAAARGAPLLDASCTGTSLVDFRRLDDGSPVPAALLAAGAA